jgi:hypothetical protein
MTRRIRIILGVIIFAVSISLLIWGLIPPERETRTQPISPADLQLPTPISLLIDPVVVS